jgi:hypothetical protein
MAETYQDFRDAMRAFESGWDRDRYEAGIIVDWQLDEWAGGPVTEFYPQYSSWGDLADAEWDAMSYRSTNSLGFVGYQFGEALLIDLGYYDDDVFYGNGAAFNTWDATWTGKNGVDSLEEFKTADAQEVAIQEAFGMNLQIIEDGLANAGKSLDDYIGTTSSYELNGETFIIELTLSGILAAAHLRGAYGTLDLLLSGAISTDENGTSILQYIDQFGGYETPSSNAIIAFYEDRLTGDEGFGTPGGNGSGEVVAGNGSYGEAGVNAQTADVVISWDYGHHTTVSDFDPATQTIFVDWIGASDLEITQTDEGVVLAVPGNNQSTTLGGVTLDQLSLGNFTILDATAADEITSLIGDRDSTPSADAMIVSAADTPTTRMIVTSNATGDHFLTLGLAEDSFDFDRFTSGHSDASALADDMRGILLDDVHVFDYGNAQAFDDLPAVDHLDVMGDHPSAGEAALHLLPSASDFII